MSVIITDADESCVPGIAAIEQECFSDPWSEQSIRSQLPGPNHVFLAAMDGNTVAGYVGLMYVIDEGYISNVAVTAAYRRQHFADRLIQELIARAQALDLAFLTLEVRASNAPAIALYDRLGFVQIGRRKNYYSHPKEDALIMRKQWKELAP